MCARRNGGTKSNEKRNKQDIMTIKPTPFTLHVPDTDLADMRERLARSRFPDQAPGEAWAWLLNDGRPLASARMSAPLSAG